MPKLDLSNVEKLIARLRSYAPHGSYNGAPLIPKIVEDAADTLEQQAAEVLRLSKALEPSAETKAAYHGEFYFEIEDGESDAGIERHRRVYVPWTTTKEIMAAIRARATISEKLT